MGKEKCSLPAFSPFPHNVIKGFFLRIIKSSDCVIKELTHSHTMTTFDGPGKQAFENTVGKGEIAHNEQFLLFPQCFLPV